MSAVGALRGSAVRSDGSIKGECHVAVFDILGFRQLVSRKSLDDVLKLVGSASPLVQGQRAAEVMADIPQISRFKKASCISLRFSDTIVLCSPDKSERGLLGVGYGSLLLLVGAVLSGIPIRGAITRGPCYISADRSEYFGEALARAHDLEKDQKWIGGILDDERIAMDNPRFMVTEVFRDHALVPATVPWGDPPRPRRCSCLNWAPFHRRQSKDGIEADLTALGLPIDDRARAKLEATLRFYRSTRDHL